jgi:hypothetical protein
MWRYYWILYSVAVIYLAILMSYHSNHYCNFTVNLDFVDYNFSSYKHLFQNGTILKCLSASPIISYLRPILFCSLVTFSCFIAYLAIFVWKSKLQIFTLLHICILFSSLVSWSLFILAAKLLNKLDPFEA